MDPAGETVGVFGGSFNPPHVSHVLACLYVLATYPVDRILVIPSYQHPFDKALADYADRLEMTRLAFRHLDGWVEVSRIEEELGGVSYTVDTLRELRRRLPEVHFRLIVGSDILGEVSRWRNSEEVQALAPLLVVPRRTEGDGAGCSGTESGFVLPAISSTEVRQRLAAGGEAGNAIPLQVREYIARRALYRAP